MLSFKYTLFLLKLPYYFIKDAYFFLTQGVKYKHMSTFSRTFKLTTVQQSFKLGLYDAPSIFLPYCTVKSNIASAYPRVANYQGYCEKYDEKSTWIVKQENRKLDDPILIYLHGGCYKYPVIQGQMESIISTYELLDKELKDKLSILYLDYTLIEDGKLPLQILELHDTYKKLATENNTNIWFLGDSAGGNLAINYLQYLKQPFNHHLPRVSKVALISPWIEIDPCEKRNQPGSSYYNNDKDIVTYPIFKPGKSEFLDSNADEISTTLREPFGEKAWENVPTLNDPECLVLVIAGESESFRDEILEWSEVALGVPFNSTQKYGDSEGKYIPEKHQYVKDGSAGKCAVEFYMQPWGMHDGLCVFEGDILPEICSDKVTSILQLDQEHYFGLHKVVKFFNSN